MFFDNWQGLLRVLVVGTLAYVALVAWLRVTGKRTVSKWNAFDLIVTIALGSTLATVLLTENVALAEGVAAMGLLITLQYAISWLSIRYGWARRAVKNVPTLLLRDGEPCRVAMRKQRVTEGELRAAVRAAGHSSFEDVDAIVLETDGNFSVIATSRTGRRDALVDVEGIDATALQGRHVDSRPD